MICSNYSISCDEEKRTCKGCYYEGRKEKMNQYEVIFSINDIIHKAYITPDDLYVNHIFLDKYGLIPATNSTAELKALLQTRYGDGDIKIINLLRKG